MNNHKSIILRFLVKSGVNPLCIGWTHISLVLYHW